ncbi:hypothetical protein AKJ16_DCAP27368, partial [Drosera capensis]
MASSSPASSLQRCLSPSLSSSINAWSRSPSTCAAHRPSLSLPSSSSSPDLSRRLSLIQLGAAVSQSHLFNSKASKLSRGQGKLLENIALLEPAVTEENALEWA